MPALRLRLASPFPLSLALGLAALAPQSATAASHQPARACTPGSPSLTVEVDGFANDTGMVRAQLYGPDGATFLRKGAWSMRLEQRRTRPGPMRFCFPIERPGDYAVAVRHDANDNGKSDWNDGGGFTRNPRLSLLNLKPAFAAAAVPVGGQAVTHRVIMQYRRGLGIGPVSR